MKILFAVATTLFLATGCASRSHSQFPQRTSQASLPSVDPLATQIARDHHGAVTSKLRLCVSSDGAVDDVALVSSSGLAAYDSAVVADAQTWRYAAPEQPACENVDVTYRTPRGSRRTRRAGSRARSRRRTAPRDRPAGSASRSAPRS